MKKILLLICLGSFVLFNNCKKDSSQGLYFSNINSYEELAEQIKKVITNNTDEEYFLKAINLVRTTQNQCGGHVFIPIEQVSLSATLKEKLNQYKDQVIAGEQVTPEQGYYILTELSGKDLNREQVMQVWYENCNDRAKMNANVKQMAVAKFEKNWILILK